MITELWRVASRGRGGAARAAVVVATEALAFEAEAFVEGDRGLVVGPDLEFDLVDARGAGVDRRFEDHPATAPAAQPRQDPHAEGPDALDAGRVEVDLADQCRSALRVRVFESEQQ